MDRLIGMLVAAYPSFDPALSAGYYCDELRRLAARWGQEAAEDGLRDCLRDGSRKDLSFAPSVAEVTNYVEAKGKAAQKSPFRLEPPPCACDLIALKGEECPHGHRWGLGALRSLLKANMLTPARP